MCEITCGEEKFMQFQVLFVQVFFIFSEWTQLAEYFIIFWSHEIFTGSLNIHGKFAGIEHISKSVNKDETSYRNW